MTKGLQSIEFHARLLDEAFIFAAEWLRKQNTTIRHDGSDGCLVWNDDDFWWVRIYYYED